MNIKVTYKKISFAYLLASFLALATTIIHTVNIEVTSEADSGPGTLRQAIMDAGDGDFIYFAPNVKIIQLLTPLPTVTRSITISGIGTVVDDGPVEGDCNALPSPVCNPEGFSATLPVAVDGSLIHPTETNSGIGLIFSSNSKVIGLKIQNFTGSVENPNAIGIGRNENGTGNLEVLCCEIANILSGPTTVDVDSEMITSNGDAIGIDQAQEVKRCLVKNIKTPSILNPTVGTGESVLATGNAIGINNFETADQCNVNNVCGGTIFANNNQSGYTLLLGQTIGFKSNTTSINTTLLTNSVGSNIKGGSISTNYSDSSILPTNNTEQLESILQYNTCGAYLENLASITNINSSAFCDIQAGDINACNNNVTVHTPFAAGTVLRTTQAGTTSSNTITNIHGGSVCLGGLHSTGFFSSAAGIVINAIESDVLSNTISNISAGCSRLDGECSQIFSQPLFEYTDTVRYILPPAVGVLYFYDMDMITDEITLTNNHIVNIHGGTHTAQGLNSSILSAGSAGTALLNMSSSFVIENTVKNIVGPALKASHSALIAKNEQASAGLQLVSSIGVLESNIIDFVCETSIHSSGTTPTINGFTFSKETEDNTTLLPLFTSGIYIDNLASTTTALSEANIVTTNNTITNILGSQTQSHGSQQGSIATGVFFRRPNITNPPTEGCTNNKIGLFEHNTISNISGGTHAPAYGMLLNQDLHLQNSEAFSLSDVLNNTISNVKGDILIPYALTQEELITECLPGNGTEDNSVLTITQLFPYGPSAGINLFASGCATVQENTIKNISSSDNNARGISTVASSNVTLSDNTITAIKGPGMFVGGASADSGLIAQAGFTTQEFEDIFPSVHNSIFDNSTSADMTQGIELGVVNWNNYLAFIAGVFPIILVHDNVVVVGNHDQVAPNIKKVLCNSNGTTTIDITFFDINHPNTFFIIQFFRNSTNTVPHGEQAITPFNKDFEFSTDENGVARARFVFIPAHKINKRDIISAHVTLVVEGSDGNGSEIIQNSGDTSEFTVQKIDKKQTQLGCITSCNKISKERTNNLNNILFGKIK